MPFRVIIDKFLEGVFFAKLVCMSPEGESEIDARTSDAVALAIRFSSPIYTNEDILSQAGIIMEEKSSEVSEEGDESIDEPLSNEYADYTLDELEESLKKAIENEEYEKASKIRDEIDSRKKGAWK